MSAESNPPIPTLVPDDFQKSYPFLHLQGKTIFDLSNYGMTHFVLHPLLFISFALVLTSLLELFKTEPELAWGFFAKRMQDYASSEPHRGNTTFAPPPHGVISAHLAGYYVLKQWASEMKFGSFVYTTNLDKQFHKSGFQNIFERHGV